MYKYHINVVDDKEMYNECVTEKNKGWGGNRSVCHQNKKPIMLHGHDEVSVKQYSTQSKVWYFEGKAKMLPKSDGATIMNSGIVLRENGFGMNHGKYLTKEVRDEVNKRRKKEKYECEEAAAVVFGKVDKPPLENNDNPFSRFFDVGAN